MEKQTGGLSIIRFFFNQNKLPLILLLVISILVGGLEAATVAAVYPILTTAFESGLNQSNFVLSVFQNTVKLLPVADQFIGYCILFIILAGLAFVTKIVSIRYRVTFGARLVEGQQKEIFSRLITADYQYFIDHKEGDIIYNTTVAPQGLTRLVTASTEFMSQLILSISVLLLLFSLSWQGTIAFIIMAIIYYVFTSYLSRRVAYISASLQVEAMRESNVILNETIGGIKQIKVFATAGDQVKKFSQTVRRVWSHFVRNHFWQQVLNPILMVVLYLFIGLVAISIRVINPGSFNPLIPVFGTFAFAVFRMVPIMGGIANATMQIVASLPNCETVHELLNERLSSIKDGHRELESFKTSIEFADVSFNYKGRNDILNKVSVDFEKGKTTAIVGRSGAGKSTIVSLILRLFDVDDGEIRIDGVNITECETRSWLGKIGFVSQETFIFNDTIRNNITFGSKYSDEEVVRAARYADADSFISRMPEGYDTPVGDKGMRLSGGQRQRIAVARAMIRNPEILIFDEATNALDNISEAAVQKAIDDISRDHTVIIIAHRLSTIVKSDKIIVMGDGRVLEEGTHRELMARRGAYHELYSSQGT